MVFNTPIHTNEQSIDRVLNAGLPVLLVFWRADCAPCRDLNPALDRLARAYAGQALIAKIDAKDNPALIQRYNVARLPSLVLVRDQRVLAQATGAAPEQQLNAWLAALLKGGGPVTPPSGPSIPLRSESSASAPPPTARPSSAQAPRPQERSAATSDSQPVVLTAATFDRVVRESTQPVLVDFWAPWCGPCRMIAPAIEQLAREFAGKAVVAKLNIDEHPTIAQRYGIMSIPTLYIFRGGQIVEQLVGAQPAPALRQALARHVR